MVVLKLQSDIAGSKCHRKTVDSRREVESSGNCGSLQLLGFWYHVKIANHTSLGLGVYSIYMATHDYNNYTINRSMIQFTRSHH
jgi:hypothetical protein